MKCLIQLVCVLSVACLVASRSLTRPARGGGMFYYQTAPGYYSQVPQRAMFVQYSGQPSYRSNRRQAEEGGVAAFAAGNTIAAGTYLRDEEQVPQTAVRFDDDEHVHAIAEAYPEQYPLDQGEKNIPADEDHEEPINEVIPQPEAPVLFKSPEAPESPTTLADAPVYPTYASKTPVVAHEEETPIVALDAPVRTPSKKVRVELEDNDEDDDAVVPFNRRGGGQGPTPNHSFFPINFGSTSGGAIAIANSYSTGKGGTATSHATAYGSPAKPKSNKRLVHAE